MRSNGLILSLGATMLLAVSSFSQQSNYKITQSVSMPGMQGQSMTNTTWVRGPRKRTQSGGMMGMGGDVANIEQCDLRQNVQLNDKKKLYHIDPIDDASPTPGSRSTTVKSQPVTKGGTVTYVSNITDTGERKTMYGMTARHLKTSMSMEASPDACMKGQMKSESDGWYIDLPEWSCPIRMQPMNYGGGRASGGCQDKVAFRSTGSGKLGFALEETRTMSMGEGQSFTSTTSTVEFSKSPLEASLFDVPTGYTLVSDTNQLYGQPDMSAMLAAMKNNGNMGDEDSNKSQDPSGRSDNTKSAMPAFAGVKIAVLVPTSRGDGVSGPALQSYLVEKLSGGNVMGVAVSSEAEAKAIGAAYILSSDISKMKQSTGGKIGGMFGKVTGVPTGGSPFDAQVDFKLVKLADGSTVLSSKAASKSESEAQRAAEVILGQEAVAVLGSVR